jgi:hypothetical protein
MKTIKQILTEITTKSNFKIDGQIFNVTRYPNEKNIGVMIKGDDVIQAPFSWSMTDKDIKKWFKDNPEQWK